MIILYLQINKEELVQLHLVYILFFFFNNSFIFFFKLLFKRLSLLSIEKNIKKLYIFKFIIFIYFKINKFYFLKKNLLLYRN